MLEITLSTILSFVTMSTLLTVYALLDLRQQLVPNRIMLAGLVIGSIIVILSGHFLQKPVLHLTSGLFMAILGYTLFRLGAIGGADAKIVFTIAIVSPGLEFTSWNNPIFEAILIAGIQLIAMLAGGYLYSRTGVDKRRLRVIPLIPILLGVYLVLQLFALF